MTRRALRLRLWGASVLLAIWAATVHAATFTVNTTADDSPAAGACVTLGARCSLRAAILAANEAPGADRIHFALDPSDPGFDSGYWTIEPASLLPAVEGPTLINGITQSGASCAGAPGEPHRLLVRLDGRSVPATRNADPGLLLLGDTESTVRGLSITGFPDAAVQLNDGGEVLCNYLGLRPDGTEDGNRDGVLLLGSGHIGGRSDAERNVITANRQSGILARGDDLLVEGNYLGTDPTGTAAVGRQGSGILLSSGSRALIGGSLPGAGNLISGNDVGVEVGRHEPYFEAVVQGNLIGTDREGLVAVPNLQYGISINSPDTEIGGAAAGQGNLISGNGASGIWVYDEAKRPQILGNRIGVSADGAPLGNVRDGIRNGGSIGTIGGVGAAANTIAHNGGSGVAIRATEPTSQPSARILANSIHSNGLLGIDVWPDPGVNPNDTRDATDPRALNYPVITAASSDGSRTMINGTLDSLPDWPFELRFYASSEADPSGHGEGELYLGSRSVTTDATGYAGFTATLPVATPADWFVSGTSTSKNGERYTSEFGPVVGASAVSPIRRMLLPAVVGLLGLFALLWLFLRRP